MTPSEGEKAAAAHAALAEVRHGMRLGLGTGSTVAMFLPLLAEKVQAGLDIVAGRCMNAGGPNAGSPGKPAYTKALALRPTCQAKLADSSMKRS